MLFAWSHAASDFYYIIPGLGLYFVDVVLRCCAPQVKVLDVVKESTGHIRVDVEKPKGWATRAGQWVAVPGVVRHEWHPYRYVGHFTFLSLVIPILTIILVLPKHQTPPI